MVQRVKVVDSTFSHNPSIGYAGENVGKKSAYFEWDFEPGYADTKWFTDIRLSEAEGDDAKRKIALLIEPHSLAPENYVPAKLQPIFDYVLTHNKILTKASPDKYLWYPFGGNWINEWKIFSKSKIVSLLTSSKRLTSGHQLRHFVANKFRGKVDVFGEPYTSYLPLKQTALREYMFSIIIENVYDDHFFTEKLIDCLSQGTIPIYWGTDLSKFFDMNGIIEFHFADKLEKILDFLSAELYNAMLPSVKKNFEIAKKYMCPEDWIYTHYPFLFKEF